ncbi:MAG: SDR family NAD(P)-dependent oxidoreductase, partial [Limnohabitans sp.]
METILLRQALVPVRIDEIGHGRDEEHTVILCGLETDGPVAEEHLLRVPYRGDTSADAFLDCTASLFSLVAEFARQGSMRRIIQVVVPQDGPGVLLGRLDGALKSISDEYRSLRFQLLVVSRSLAQDKLLEILRFGRTTAHRTLVYSGTVGNELTERVWELAPEQPIARTIWKDGGVYLITGGLGAIGRAVAADIIGGTSGATVVLVSRNVSDASSVAASLQGESTHARVVIKSVDVAEQGACTLLVAAILSEFGRLDGILHCAGIVADAGFLGRPEDGLCNSLRPKARGVENLDLASAAVDLDFFVCFSSLASSHGNPGQVDYAAANAFMDAFMDHRAQEVRKGNRRGRSLSINWPLWREGGMRGSAESARRHQMRFGMVPISNESALLALHRALAWSTESAVAIIEGVRTLLPLEVLDPARKLGTLESGEATLLGSSADDEPSVVSYLLEAVSRATQVPVEAIAPDQPFSDYGIDSILALDLTAELEARFGQLDRTVLFEYPTLRMLTQYLNSRVAQAAPSGAVASGPLVATNGMTADAQVVERLRAKVADAVGMPVESISDMVPFSDYGVDSILVLDLTTRLEQEFGPLEKTVFFEYPTIKELAVHLARQQARPIARALVGTPPRNDVLGTRYSDIAVVGISGRYPKSPDLESFWNNLKQGMDCVEEIPNERWDWRGRSPRNRWGGFIEGVDQFDPLLFNISPRDAERIDPQERLFLQCAYAALEDAGYTPDEFGGAETAREVGVFVGVMYEEYQLYAVEAQARGIDVAVSGSAASVANRVSYSFNFRGPSMALDTMCSSSLTAIHLACQSIRNGDCRSAIAGGVNVSIHPNKYLLLSQARFESTEGRCASFGRGGNGYVPAEGVGVVVLKELATALKDGDHVYGVIRGSAINSGGRSQGYTAPNPDAQAAVIAAALRRADVDPRDISYVEAHGTGTHLGDPIEVAGLARAFTQPSARAESCAIGSVKSNIGHAEAAAGIAGFTKVLLQMKHRMLVPSIHSDELNPLIDFERTPFRVQRRAESWEPLSGLGTAKSLRRAAISSFGAGGANAHIVLEEYPEPMAGNAGEQSVVDVGSLFVLSARTEVQLQQSATRLREWLKTQSGEGVNLMDVAYTLQVGRVAREFRLGVVASRLPELLDGLSAYLEVELVDRPAGVLVGTAHPAGGSRGVEEQVFDEMVRTNRVGDLLAAWVEGADMPWRRWHSAARRRMSLPTYPFAKERYWIETGPAPVLQRASVPSLSVDAARPASAEVFDRIRELLASLLQVPIDALDGTRSLDAYGIDSILLMEFSDELANQFGIDLGSAELFLQPTIDQLVTHILSRVGDASTEAPQTGWNGDHSALQEGNRSCLGEFVGLRLLNTHHTPVAVFYPTHATPRAVRMGAFTLSVAVDAPPEPRVKGLIVICHGREGSQLMHHDLAERLASAGYIVAALEHPTDSWKDTSLADSPDFFSTRPREALQAIDAMLEHPHWQPLLRDLPIGIVAHSAGAIDALSLLGARVTVASASESASICRHVPGVINLPEEQSLPSASERLLTPDLKDSRIQGCVLLAPFTEPFDSSSLASVETPIRIYLAEKDETLDNGTNGYRAQKTLPRCEVVTLPA